MPTTTYKVLGQAQAGTEPTVVYTVPALPGTGAAVISSITMSNTSTVDATADVYLLNWSTSQSHTSVYGSFNYTSDSADNTPGPSVMVYANGMFTGIPVNGDLNAVNSTDGIIWTSSGGNGSGPFNDFIYANSTYVAVGAGDATQVRTSTNTITWSNNGGGFVTSTIFAITYGNGLFVAGGAGGTLTTSTNATAWTARTSTFGTTTILALAYGAGVYVAAGNTGQLRSSTDAITWTTRTTPNLSSTAISGLAYGNGVFVAVGGSGLISTSTNGTTWSSRTSLPSGTVWGSGGTLNNAKFSGGRFLLSGTGIVAYSVAMSTDGITRTYTRPGSFSPTVTVFGNGLLVAGNSAALTASLKTLPYKSNALVYGTTIPANSSTTITAGITLPEGYTVQARASAASSITVHAFGCEIY